MLRRIINRIFIDAAPLIHLPTVCSKKVVLLLGFGGSKRKNFTKLISAYNNAGYTVISHVNPLLTPNFISDSFERQIGEVIQDTLLKLGGSSSSSSSSGGNCNNIKIPLIAHIYSNNGTWVYASLMKKNLLVRNPDRLIFDSAPYLVYNHLSLYDEASIFTRVVTSIVLGEAKYHHPIISPVIRAVLLPCFAVRRLLEYIPILNDFLLYDYIQLNLFLRDKMPVIPTMFIYSKGDNLVPKENIMEFISFLRIRAFKIEEVVFGDDVGHTGSFYKHKDTYTKNMFKFLEEDSN